jgi:hypothetical protein
MGKPTIASLKKRLDKLCAEKCKVRDKICRWCKTPGNDLEAHHFVSKKHAATRFDLENLFALHRDCHFFATNHPQAFKDFLIREIGQEAVDKLVREGNRTQPITLVFLEAELERLLLTTTE